MMALLTLLTQLSSPVLASPPKAEVSQALEAFSAAVAAGDADAAAPWLHPDSVQVIQMADGPMTLDTNGYLGLIRAGTVGGHAIELDVTDVNVTGSVATASAVRFTGPFRLTDAVSLAQLDGRWQIVAMSVAAEPRAEK